jgi:hypothetical protein
MADRTIDNELKRRIAVVQMDTAESNSTGGIVLKVIDLFQVGSPGNYRTETTGESTACQEYSSVANIQFIDVPDSVFDDMTNNESGFITDWIYQDKTHLFVKT